MKLRNIPRKLRVDNNNNNNNKNQPNVAQSAELAFLFVLSGCVMEIDRRILSTLSINTAKVGITNIESIIIIIKTNTESKRHNHNHRGN